MPRGLGVCSWSLQPESARDLVDKVRQAGCRAVQLHLDPIRKGAWDLDETVSTLTTAGIAVLSGMGEMAGEDYTTLDSIRETGGVRPDAHWPENLAAASKNAEIARLLNISLVTFHAGFLPHDPGDPERDKLVRRVRDLADAYAERGVSVALETGQESAQTLLEVLEDLDHTNVSINFDPANMILYGMGNPIEAMRELTPHIAQVHIKDATASAVPGRWGTEVPAGTGEVDWDAFFNLVRTELPDCDLMIEREQGDARVADISTARQLVLEYMGEAVVA